MISESLKINTTLIRLDLIGDEIEVNKTKNRKIKKKYKKKKRKSKRKWNKWMNNTMKENR